MPLKLTCPDCARPVPLDEPFPLPGSLLKCSHCATTLAVSYPPGVMERLKARGKTFREESQAAPPHVPRARAPQPRAPSSPRAPVPTTAPTTVDGTRRGFSEDVDSTTVAKTPAPTAAWMDPGRTVPGGRTPYGDLPGGESDAAPPADPPRPRHKAPPPAAPPKRRGIAGWLGRVGVVGCLAVVLGGGLLGAATAGGGYWYYSRDLPSIEALRGYDPPTVTTVYDHNGELLGEIYEQRRYVVPLDDIPLHVRQAFMAAEDANFYNHGGVDFLGLTRAMFKNLQAGRMAQGASTITQQVTRNFLLTRDKKIERKIKEMILAWRIEEVYTKDHILYLYLNEIYLGSGAYGVEAASRVYFGKSVRELSIAEAAVLAGLPQRPSDYSPHRHFDKARERQSYVLQQMESKGYITADQRSAEGQREIVIVERENEFVDKSPHFTEYVRRYLVDTYGHERVYNEGLQVTTTCDLPLQQVAQRGVVDGVADVDQRMGFRREGVTHLSSDAEIAQKRAEIDAAIRKAWEHDQDPAGRIKAPATLELEPGARYDAVVLEVQRKWARVGIGEAEAIIPLAWSEWVYDPDPRRSWRFRTQTDLTEVIDGDGDGSKEGAILRKGDVVLVRLEATSTRDDDVAKAFKDTPGASKAYAAARLWQNPEVEGALLSVELPTGAVRAMVGGADYEKSEFNRAIQSRRQVGSTFKPIVYAAAIDSQKVTSATMVADAPLAFAAQNADFIWKPANYGNDYMGNITLRKALALSRNTCTVRVLETIDPGMNDDVIYKFARSLGIGGPPFHQLPEEWEVRPDTDVLCPWIREDRESTICMDRYPPKDPDLTNTAHRAQLGPDDEYWCRACDMSMGLGSASLTMEELVRAYTVFATGGKLVQPYYIEEVRDRSGAVLERHDDAPAPQVVDPGVATIVNWLLQGVVNEGTGAAARKLGLNYLAGKTGTTNDEKDTWFVGFTNDVITAAWVGYDQPRSLGVSSTGGRTALPIWMDYMAEAAPKSTDRPFPAAGDVEWALIDEATGRRVSSGGRSYPFLQGTAPESSGASAGQFTIEDVTDL